MAKKIIYRELISIENLKAGLARTKNNVSFSLNGEIKSNITDKKIKNKYNILITFKAIEVYIYISDNI